MKLELICIRSEKIRTKHVHDLPRSGVIATLPDTEKSRKLVKLLNKNSRGDIYTTRLTSVRKWSACTTGGL